MALKIMATSTENFSKFVRDHEYEEVRIGWLDIDCSTTGAAYSRI